MQFNRCLLKSSKKSCKCVFKNTTAKQTKEINQRQYQL